MRFEEQFARPGLPPPVRLLVLTMVGIWRADWDTVQAAAATGRQLGMPRSEFEEVLLQAVLFCGFPRVVTAFEQLAVVWPAERAPAGGALPVAEQAAAGRALFAAIYGRNDVAVRTMLQGYHQEFHDFVLEAAYGRILARPGLSPQIRELLATGVLAAMDQLRQFVAHARGALQFGSSRAELREVLVTVFGDVPATDEWLQRVRT